MNVEEKKLIQVQPITYQTDLAQQLFNRIEQRPWAILLRSASTQHIDSRFDILVANPIATLVTVGNDTTIQQPSGVTSSQQDPFTLLAELQERYLPAEVYHSELPFVGGALGYFGYDLGRRIEPLAEQAQ
ncbi:MAG: aminodeoxychorismate synthase component I, partial [Vibrio metschnikovii]|nr:aminodeoxychorismate synthase component I [Vibrio metschnikovii]